MPFNNGKMAGYSATASWLIEAPLGPGSALFPWNSVYRSFAPNGFGAYRDGGAGALDGNASVTYAPNAADSFNRGVVDALSNVQVHYLIRSPLAGFGIRQNDLNPNSAARVSSGATFTGTSSGTILLTAASVTGVIAKAGYLTGAGVPASFTISQVNAGTYGGAGTYNTNIASTLAGLAITAAANAPTTLNTPLRASYQLASGFANNVQIVGAFGNMVATGVEHYNGNRGVTLTDFGQGGTTALQHASLDDAAQRAFWQREQFNLVIVVLGMNDRSIVDPTGYGTAMATIVSRIQSCPTTRVILVRQPDPPDAATTGWAAFEGVLQNVARSMNCGYIDMKASSPSLANYATAFAANLMDGASVHLNGAGNTIVGNYIASIILAGLA